MKTCPLCRTSYTPKHASKPEAMKTDDKESREQWISGTCSTACWNKHMREIDDEEEKPKPKGMILEVYRSSRLGDCTNGGISAKAGEVVVVGPGVPPIFDPRDRPIVVIDERMGYRFLRPIDDCPKTHAGWMFGGNFAWTSDSRFRELSEQPLPIHDRKEA